MITPVSLKASYFFVAIDHLQPNRNEIKLLKEDFIVKMPQMSLPEWQKRFGTEKAWAAAIAKFRGGRMVSFAPCQVVLGYLPLSDGQRGHIRLTPFKTYRCFMAYGQKRSEKDLHGNG